MPGGWALPQPGVLDSPTIINGKISVVERRARNFRKAKNGRILTLPPIASQQERGVYAASTFPSPQASCFNHLYSDIEAA